MLSEIELIPEAREWTFESTGPGDGRTCKLAAYWGVSRDSISENYPPAEYPARVLLEKWARDVLRAFPDGMIPISWFVVGDMILEFMAIQHDPLGVKRDFLTVFTWPENPDTGELLRWTSLPVVDKFRDAERGDKGWFIQEATGWKPSILQPFVYLPALMNRPLAELTREA